MSENTTNPFGGSPGFGVLWLDKPVGPTSHDVVGWVRWALGVRQVGHCGTLDPLASGLMIVCVGAATRLVPYLTLLDKTYRAEVALGRSTVSADREGETVATANIDATQISAAIQHAREMTGLLMLPPPAYSAIKVGGQRAHKRVRRGEDVALEPRPMTVFSAEDVISEAASEPCIAWTCRVSKGTYVRSLAEELGRRVGVPAHLAGLRRLSCADFRVDDPRTVSPLVAQMLPPRDGRPPKYRCALPEVAEESVDARTASRKRLHRHLIDPIDCLPMPSIHRPEGDPVLTRMGQGQKCQVEDVLADLDDGLERVVIHGVEAGRRIAIIASVTEQRMLAPEKVVRESNPPAAPPKSA